MIKILHALFKRRSKLISYEESGSLAGYKAFETGKVHFEAQKNQEAIDSFDNALAHGFRMPELFSLRGSCLQSLQWHLDAIDDFSSAIELEPDDCNIFFQRAMSKTAVGDQVGFEEDLKHAIQLSQLDTPLNRTYNQQAKELGWPNAAEMYFSKSSLLLRKPKSIIEKNAKQAASVGRRTVVNNTSL